MENFTYCNKTRILFGKDTEQRLGKEAVKWGTKALLHYGSGSIKASGLYDRVVASLQEAGLPFVELGGVAANPHLSLVREGIDLCHREGVDLILAVGGGSVIDSAKAIALGVPCEGDVWDFFETQQPAKHSTLPVGVVLTIPAAGSETSDVTVVVDEVRRKKHSYSWPEARPAFAILNPELTYTLSPYQTACGVSDMISHILERYFSRSEDVELTSRMCEGTLKAILATAPRLLADPRDYGARAEIMWAGTIAHSNILGVGRIQDWGVHGMEHAVSGGHDTAHGAGLAVLTLGWMRYYLERDAAHFARFARRVFDVTEADDRVAALEGIARLEAFYQFMQLPTRLSHLGITGEAVQQTAAAAKTPRGRFEVLMPEDVAAIFEIAR